MIIQKYLSYLTIHLIVSTYVDTITELSGTYRIAHTKARIEKVFAWDMLRQGIGYFLTMREKSLSLAAARGGLCCCFSPLMRFSAIIRQTGILQ